MRGADLIKGHSTFELARELEINGEVREACQRLDQYYITTRYPDAVVAGAPYELFTRSQAAEALEFSKTVLRRVREEVGDDPEGRR
jgi:HEPN domain-containing protein